MSALLPLRPYQRACLDSVREILTRINRPAVVLPTGGGKTVVFAHQADEWLREHPGTRVLVLVHTEELVQQAKAKILAVAPHLVVGIVKAKFNEVTADVIVGSVQTLRNARRRAQIQRVSLVIVDECHHATAATYLAILEHFGCMVETLIPGEATALSYEVRPTPVIGFTATLARGDGGPLGKVWQEVAFSRDIAWMIRKGFLIPPRGKRIEVPELDLSKVKKSGGDFAEGALGDALVGSLAPEIIAKAYLEHAADRKALAFFPTVASAEVAVQAFIDQGVDARVIHGGMSAEDRKATLAWHKRGTVLINCMILTEGYDDPEVDCIIMARPTKSKPLYIQIVGRGLRVDTTRQVKWEQDCLLMDVVGVTARMDLRSMADLSDKDVKEPRDGQTLLDLEDAFDSGEAVEDAPEEHYAGPVAVKDFDPLAAKSSRAWNKTATGVYFLPAGKDAYVFLIELPDGWAVAWVNKTNSPFVCPSRMHDDDCTSRHGKRGALTEHRGMDLEMAMTWGEDLAVDMGADPMETLTKKAAPWRRGPAKDKPKALATSLGIQFSPDIRAGELSDRISRVMASRRVDPVAKALVEQAQRVEVAA
jgi:superfamily II DNA or RNA helicase